MIAAGQKVFINYAGSIENGNVFVNTWINGGPVEVEAGRGTFLPRFEEALAGMSRGERKTIVIPAAQAYGARDEENVVRVPLRDIPRGEDLPVGSFISLQTGRGPARVRVASIEGDDVVFDCNHELAGHDLTFEIELVRDGRETAVDSESGSSGCGCGCDKLKEQLMGEACACGHSHGHDDA